MYAEHVERASAVTLASAEAHEMIIQLCYMRPERHIHYSHTHTHVHIARVSSGRLVVYYMYDATRNPNNPSNPNNPNNPNVHVHYTGMQ